MSMVKKKCKCDDCRQFDYLINNKSVKKYPCQPWQGRERTLYWNKANFYFSELYEFPDEETIKKEFKINKTNTVY